MWSGLGSMSHKILTEAPCSVRVGRSRNQGFIQNSDNDGKGNKTHVDKKKHEPLEATTVTHVE